MNTFEFAAGDMLGLPTSENHFNFKWVNDECNVFFSVCRMGDAASCHFSSDKSGLRLLREAIEQFIELVNWLFDWCKMIIAKVARRSVGKLLLDCGFFLVGSAGNVSVFGRKL